MQEDNVRMKIREILLESGEFSQQGSLISFFDNDREYLVTVNVFDVTDWQKETDE